MRYLGIDYGTKRIGLSLSDDEGSFAFPYKTIQNDEEVIDALMNICGEEDVSEVVVGIPEKGETKNRAKRFGESVHSALEIPVHVISEDLSSFHVMSLNPTKPTARNPKEKMVKDDAKSAAIILQRFLDKK